MSHVSAIAGRMSLRAPQRELLEILDRITGIVPPSKHADVAAALAAIKAEYPQLLIQHLRTAKQEFLKNVSGGAQENRPEDYLVRALIDFDDICYDEHADLLYNLAGQLVKHLRSYLSEEDTINVLQYHQRGLAETIHAQMQSHRWEKSTGYQVTRAVSNLLSQRPGLRAGFRG